MVAPSPRELERRAARPRLVLSDCDGVLTDGGVYYSDRGEELKRFSIRDGMGVERLAAAGVACGVMSGERSPSILRRAEKLGLAHDHVLLGIKDKRREIGRLLERSGLALDQLAYIGDDMNDLETLVLVGTLGLTAAPADALPAGPNALHHPTAGGGNGAFRDCAEWILALRAGTTTQGGPV